MGWYDNSTKWALNRNNNDYSLKKNRSSRSQPQLMLRWAMMVILQLATGLLSPTQRLSCVVVSSTPTIGREWWQKWWPIDCGCSPSWDTAPTAYQPTLNTKPLRTSTDRIKEAGGGSRPPPTAGSGGPETGGCGDRARWGASCGQFHGRGQFWGRGGMGPGSQLKFQGACKGLKGHVYDCLANGSRMADMYTKTTQDVAIYMGSTCKSGMDIHRAIDNLKIICNAKNPEPSMPNSIGIYEVFGPNSPPPWTLRRPNFSSSGPQMHTSSSPRPWITSS